MAAFKNFSLLFFAVLLWQPSVQAQPLPADSMRLTGTPPQPPLLSLQPAQGLHKGRFWLTTGTGLAVYSGVSLALWHAWYKDYPLGGFQTFNDWGEWKDMDKAGHLFSANMECNYAFQGALWTGMKRRNAMWTAVGVGTGIQATIEIMDGFSQEWGFSWADIAFNTLGVSLFAAQELAWREQRIKMKVSGSRPNYDNKPLLPDSGGAPMSLDERAAELYGTSPFHVILKDYNALTVWGSFNISAFMANGDSGKFPKWLNLALGYGAGNIYGGFENKWTTEDGRVFSLDPSTYPRFRQFYLSPDIDWTRIKTRHRWLKTGLSLLNWLKFPAPALEVNTLGGLKFHALHW
jgi:hypothetical protein